MIYFTADCHFGHQNVIRFCNRPYATAEEMNDDLIKRWNSKVMRSDTVYVLGDMFYRAENPEKILKTLKGKKVLIVGNHDDSWMKKIDLSRHFKDVQLMAEISTGGAGATLCHYPMTSWRHQMRTYMIHGHIHNNTDLPFWDYLTSNERILNAGVDVNDYYPVTLNELIENNKKFKDASKNRSREGE